MNFVGLCAFKICTYESEDDLSLSIVVLVDRSQESEWLSQYSDGRGLIPGREQRSERLWGLTPSPVQ
jgi:hypothetical protein